MYGDKPKSAGKFLIPLQVTTTLRYIIHDLTERESAEISILALDH